MTIFSTAKADDGNNVTSVNPLIFWDGALHNLISLMAAVPTGQLRELVITHSFECAVEGDDRGTWFNTDILVDGMVVSPTASDNASCPSTPPDNNLPSLDDYITTSQTVVTPVGGGNHTVLVRGKLVGFNAGERVRIDDQSLTVVDEAP